MYAAVRLIVLGLLLISSLSACDDLGGLFGFDDFEIDGNIALQIDTVSTAGLDGPTLRRVDDINRRIEKVRQTLESGVEIGPETRESVERSVIRLADQIDAINRTTDEGIDKALIRVDRALRARERYH